MCSPSPNLAFGPSMRTPALWGWEVGLTRLKFVNENTVIVPPPCAGTENLHLVDVYTKEVTELEFTEGAVMDAKGGKVLIAPPGMAPRLLDIPNVHCV